MGRDKGNSTDPSTLTLYLTDASFSLFFKWKVNVSNQPWDIELIPSRKEMMVSTKNIIGYVLNISDGTILHTFNVPFDNPYILPLFGSLCLYKKRLH